MKSLLTAGLALGLAVEPALAAELPPVAPAAIRLAVDGCTPDTIYGFALNEPYGGDRHLQLTDAAAPFNSAEVIATSRSKTLVGVDLWGAWPDDSGTVEERKEAAADLLDALSVAVDQSGRFAERAWDEETETMVYSHPVDAPDSGLQLELSQMGVSVIVSCADESRRQLAMDEYLGRTRVERPTPPAALAPVRIDRAECDDPVRAEAIYDDFEAGGGADVLNLLRASTDYFEHLTQWYGQELMDKGVWTQDDRDAFQMSFLQDRTIMKGFEEQMGRLEPLLGLAMEVAEARDAGDSVGSCRAAVDLTDLIIEIGESNEAQWTRATTLYRAEARRLGVTLEE